MSSLHVNEILLSFISMPVLYHSTYVPRVPSLIKHSRVPFIMKGRIKFYCVYYINCVFFIHFPADGHRYIPSCCNGHEGTVIFLASYSHGEKRSSGSWIKSYLLFHILSVKVTDASRGTCRTLAKWMHLLSRKKFITEVFYMDSFLISDWLYAEDMKGDVSLLFSQCDHKKKNSETELMKRTLTTNLNAFSNMICQHPE